MANFNHVHSSTRNCIERAFGQLKRRFAALHSPLRIKTNRICTTIIACCVLHNIAKRINDGNPVEDEELLPQADLIQPVIDQFDDNQPRDYLRQLGLQGRQLAAENL